MIHARNFASRVPGARLVGLADPFEDSLVAAREELDVEFSHTDFQDALREPGVDAVVVATPTVAHCEIVVAAAEAGKHILCEKPMAMNVVECDAMIDAVEANGVKLQIGFMRRFDSEFVAAKQRIDAGEIGDVVLVKSLTHGPSTPREWMYDLEKSNGPLAEVNSHDIDTLRWFTESEFSEVYALAGNYRCPEARKDFPDFYDNVVMIASFENGMQGFVGGAVSVGYGYDARVEIVGTRGVLFVGQECRDSAAADVRGEGKQGREPRGWRDVFKDAYLAEDRGFVECIRTDSAPRVTGLDGKMAVRVVNAANRSIGTKEPIRLRNT